MNAPHPEASPDHGSASARDARSTDTPHGDTGSTDSRSTDTPLGDTGSTDPRSTRNTGPGRLLIAVYAVFAISATARAGYQILTKFSDAPLAYLLSAFAAVVYLVATVSLAKAGSTWFKVSLVAVLVELVGVLVVGALSIFDPVAFPHETVWSLFGRGYAFIPLLLPILGLVWLYRRRPGTRPSGAQN
ncbi:hypothetical protein [Pseudarthrobacter sulfonivorans]|uniref:hypothetical protein n=1 Tax=Pseudarthrobacter sulfonivorans TaxID=121292 RepID=UPI00295E5017|nr:hypothetical protein [Pseudarthrobacter sulfonivorans]